MDLVVGDSNRSWLGDAVYYTDAAGGSGVSLVNENWPPALAEDQYRGEGSCDVGSSLLSYWHTLFLRTAPVGGDWGEK